MAFEKILTGLKFYLLIVESENEYYTYSAHTQVLYNLNMAKKDSVRDKVTIRKGLSEIDLSESVKLKN